LPLFGDSISPAQKRGFLLSMALPLTTFFGPLFVSKKAEQTL